MALVKPHIERRDVRPLTRELRDIVIKLGGTPLPAPSVEPEPVRKLRCHLCPRQADKKTKQVCEKCRNHICTIHRNIVCSKCF